MITLLTASCQPTLVQSLPTALATQAPQIAPSLQPTRTPQAIASAVATQTPIPPAQPTLTATASLAAPTTSNANAWERTSIIGRSVEGRSITVTELGTGDKLILLVGGIHAGFEANTVQLVQELLAYYQANPSAIRPHVTLAFITSMNPDGLLQGRQAAGRFNRNGVDLNRNWGCEWQAQAYWRDEQVNPGAQAFSEPETRAVADYIRTRQPSAAIFYHAAADGVFAGECGIDHGSAALAQVLGEAADYSYGETFSAYTVTGTAASWVDGLGIPAVDLELTTTRDSEFERNLKGVNAVQDWVNR